MDNLCVCCGVIIPEGLQVCPRCEKNAIERRDSKLRILTIGGRMPSRNEAENTSRRNCYAGAGLKKGLTDLVMLECIRQKIPHYNRFIEVEAVFYEKDMRRDSDNIYSAMKYIKDGMQNAGVIPKDSRFYINETILPIRVDKENPRIEIRIKE